VFAFEEGEAPDIAYPVECWHCGSCVIDCPTGAVSLRLPLFMQIVPSPALYGPTGPEDAEAERKAAAFTRSIVL
jgi:ferredoxin